MSAASSARILICDDHPVVRMGLKGMLSGEPDFEVVGEAEDGQDAVALANELRPDVVLMDLRMPKMDGVEAIRHIKVQHEGQVEVLVLTTYESDADILKAVEAGASGYLLKDAPREELFAAIRTVAGGGSPLAPAVAARLVKRMRGPAEEALSAREIEVLELVSQGAGNKEIAKRLWISEATVKSHMLHIFEKLGVDDRTAAVTVALRRRILRLEEE